MTSPPKERTRAPPADARSASVEDVGFNLASTSISEAPASGFTSRGFGQRDRSPDYHMEYAGRTPHPVFFQKEATATDIRDSTSSSRHPSSKRHHHSSSTRKASPTFNHRDKGKTATKHPIHENSAAALPTPYNENNAIPTNISPSNYHNPGSSSQTSPISTWDIDMRDPSLIPKDPQAQSTYSHSPQKIKSIYTTAEDQKMATKQLNYPSLLPHEQEEQEKWAQKQILAMGVCIQGFNWKRIDPTSLKLKPNPKHSTSTSTSQPTRKPLEEDTFEGYQCEGGSHFIPDSLLAEGKGGYYQLQFRPHDSELEENEIRVEFLREFRPVGRPPFFPHAFLGRGLEFRLVGPVYGSCGGGFGGLGMGVPGMGIHGTGYPFMGMGMGYDPYGNGRR